MIELREPDLVQLTFTAALAHSADDIWVEVLWFDGRMTVIGSGGDLNACQFRRLVAERDRMQASMNRIAAIRIGGSVSARNGGVVIRRVGDGMEFWFASTLCPFRLETVLTEADLPLGNEQIDALLRPDELLGVTWVAMQPPRPTMEALALRVADQAHVLCAVEELISGDSRFRHDPTADRFGP